MTVKRKKFAPEFKRRVVELFKNSDKPAPEIAKELGILAESLYKWKA